ncbi:MAG: LLM class F420-dependent oxidoreductase, partial [Mycobacterium sp.]
QAAIEAGRDPAHIGMGGQVSWNGNADDLADGVRSWADAGASQVSINTMGAGLTSVDDHLAVLTSAAEAARSFAD